MEFGLANQSWLLLGFGGCLAIVLLGVLVFAIKRDLQEKKKNEGQPKEPRKVA